MNNQKILSIKINNKNPVELNQLTISLNALANQYDNFLKKNQDFNYAKAHRKLYISKLEEGSIYIELLPALMPLINDFNTIAAFANYLKDVYGFFLGYEKKLCHQITKTDCVELGDFINQIASDNESNIAIGIKGDNNITNVIVLDSIKSNAVQNAIRKHIESNMQEDPKIYHKQLMYWANASFIRNKTTDGKVIISNIDKNPKKVIFEQEQDKIIATTHNVKFPKKNWQDLAYIVDVEVSYLDNVPKVYKITKLYSDEIFDSEEDS